MPGAGECDRCDGRGWIVDRDRGAGSARRCPCSFDVRRRALLASLAIPPKYAMASLDGFRTDHQDADVAATLLSAKAVSRRYLDHFLDDRTGELRTSGLVYVGPPGGGKTHLATAVLRAVVTDYAVTGRFVDFTDFLARVRSTYAQGSDERTEEVISPLLRVRVLVLDELGAQKPTDHTVETLYRVINTRYTQRLPTIFTSNYRFERDVPASLHSRLAAPLISRILEMAHQVPVGGWDYRAEVLRYRAAP